MATLMRWLQILLDEDRYGRLEQLAARRGASVALSSVRGRQILAADPIPLTD